MGASAAICVSSAGWPGNYARTGMVALRADPEICATCTSKAACFNGTATSPGCPMFSFPRQLDSNANCTLCASCVKTCPNDALTITVRKPTKELWFIRKPKLEESALAMAIMGIVLIQNVTMLSGWNEVLGWIRSATGIANYAVIFTVAFAVAVTAPVGLLALASRLTAAGGWEGVWRNFARFGYALIPLDVAGHIAHNMFHLLAEGGSVVSTVSRLFGSDARPGSPALVDTGTIQILQFSLVALGLAASLYTAYRIAQRDPSPARRLTTLRPYAAVIVLLGGVNVYLFTLPMAMRM